MFAVALIVFREVLEATLIVSIVLAATRMIPRRWFWVEIGIAGGLVGCGVVAALTLTFASLFQGTAQDIVTAAILFIAVGLIGWHVVWMNKYGRRMATDLRKIGQDVAASGKHMSVLAVVVGLAVMREGSEIVLMLQGLWASGAVTNMAGGAVLGLSAGLLMGALIYAGFLTLSLNRVFAVTNFVLVLIAAGMAARGANFLTQAGILTPLGTHLWDTSRILSEQSLIGQLCATLIGYIARPSGIEVLFYGATVLVVSLLMLISKGSTFPPLRAMIVVTLALTSLCLMSVYGNVADIFSPYGTQSGKNTKSD